MKTHTPQLSNIEMLQKGWGALVRTLGPEQARNFIFSFPKKKGDSVAYWKDFWGGKSVREIYKTITNSKRGK